MAVNNLAPLFAYGMGDSLLQLPPQPIVSRRNPTANDLAQIGTLWVNTLTNTIFALASLTAGVATWTSTPAAGATVLASLEVTGAAGLDVSNVASTTTISSVFIDFDNAGALTTIAGDLTVAGTTTFTGDLDLTSAALIDITSTLNAAPAIYLHANGGIAEQIRIHSDQGTSVNSVELDSDAGGITLVSGLASTDAINLSATAGGIDVDGILQINIASSEAAINALRLVSSNAAGGIDIDCGTGGATLDSTGAISIDGAAASNFTVGGAGIDLTLSSTLGRVIVNAEEAAANAITLVSAAGGLDCNTALQTNIDSSQAAANAIRIIASNAAGGIDIDSGTAGITVDTTGAFSIDGALGSNITVTGAAQDLELSAIGGSARLMATENAVQAIRLHANGGILETIQLHADQGTSANSIDLLSDLGGITLTATGNATADAINISAPAGGLDVDAALQINIDGAQVAADAIRIFASNAAGGIDIDSGTAGTTVDTTGAFSIDGATASNVTVTGAGQDLTLSSVLGSVLVSSTENAPLAIRLHANGGVTETIQLHADQSTAVNSIDLLSDLGGIALTATAGIVDINAGAAVTVDTTAGISLDSATASNITVTGAGQDLTLASIGGSVAVVSTEDIANSIWLHANAGVSETIEIQAEQGTTANAITLQSDQGGITLIAPNFVSNDAINLTATAGGIDVDAALQINVASSQAAANAVVINASNAAGGIDLLTGGGEITINAAGGNVTMTPGTVVAAGPGAVLNSRVGVATITGQVTASGADIDLDITNAFIVPGCGVLATVSNQGANDADIQIEGVNTATAGHLILHCINQGPAALNGNITVTFWILN